MMTKNEKISSILKEAFPHFTKEMADKKVEFWTSHVESTIKFQAQKKYEAQSEEGKEKMFFDFLAYCISRTPCIY
jgi:hypothetical protein